MPNGGLLSMKDCTNEPVRVRAREDMREEREPRRLVSLVGRSSFSLLDTGASFSDI
jgi:hypothetical protein